LTPKDSQDNKSPDDEISLRSLEARIDELIRACRGLTDENQALRDQHGHLIAERAALIEKSELARSRVEAMIARLKAMEIGV
jgi:cell division protein ZapB